jgi:uncharacterized protein
MISGTAVLAASSAEGAKPPSPSPIARRPLGKTGAQVSILALGGYHLGMVPEEKEAVRLVHRALDEGITFLDNAWEYHDGKSELWMGKALEGKRDRAFLMTKCCSHGRDKVTALEQLDMSLRRLKTDHLDLWQIHEVAWDDDPAKHFMKNGAVEALTEAKKQGKVRFVGFTGHKSPKLHLEMLSHGFAFDTVQMPINAFDANFRSFQREVLPELQKHGMGVIGMKSLGGDGEAVKAGLVTPEEAIRYALSQPIASLVSGIDSMKVLEQNLRIARAFQPMSGEEQEALRQRLSPRASAGEFEQFKSSRKYEGPIGRAQRGIPFEG